MIFNTINLLRTANKTGLMIEELFFLQTIYDYQEFIQELKQDEIKELTNGYLEYFKKFNKYYDTDKEFQCKLPWANIVAKLIRDEWIIDFRKNKSILKLSELEVSEKFMITFKGNFTDEELFAKIKAIYPKQYKNQYGSLAPNFNMSVKEENELFKIFQKKILSGNRRDKWNEFYYITSELHESVDEVSAQRFDRYITSFYDNIEAYKQITQ